MLNHWDCEVVLLSTKSEIISGFDIPKEVDRNSVFAERKSATRTEFYSAGTINRRIDEVFVVNALDYQGEIYLLYGDDLYDVVRSYQTSMDRVELSCERRAPR